MLANKPKTKILVDRGDPEESASDPRTMSQSEDGPSNGGKTS